MYDETNFLSSGFLHPSNGQFTITVDRGSSVTLNVDINLTPTNNNELDIYWEKQGNKSADFETLSNQGPGYAINSVTEEDAGVYYAYFRDYRNAFTGSLFRVIVRGKLML